MLIAAEKMPARYSVGAKLNLICDELWSNAPFLWSVVFVIYALALVQALKRLWQPVSLLGDFGTFRDAAIALAQGHDLYAGPSNQYVYPPLIAFLFQPFGWMSLRAAGAVDLGINLSLSLLTLWIGCLEISCRFLGQSSGVIVGRIALIAALLTSDKLHAEFNMWETNALMLFLITIALTLADRRPTLAGMALGFAFNIKYLPLTLLPYLVLRRRWRMAGAFLISALLFAALPAVSMGWSANLGALESAYAGLARLFGVHVVNAAHVLSMTDWRTISITSGIARLTDWPPLLAMLLSGTIALALFAVVCLAYKRYNVPFMRWPAAPRQVARPYCPNFAIEWTVIILLTLIFSPFTNSAHLYLLLLANIATGTLFISMPRPEVRPLIIGTAFLCAGILYPPGGDAFRDAERTSKWVGLPAWCVLVYSFALIWSALSHFRTQPRRICDSD